MLVGARPQITYVIKNWSINPEAPPGHPLVHVQGRAPGVISWFLNLIGIAPTVEMRLTHETVEFAQGSMFGQMRRTVPLTQVASITHGYVKPLGLLVLGLVTLPMFGIGLIFIIMYFLKKSLSLVVGDTGAGFAGMQFQRSVIEGRSIDEASAAHVAGLIDYYAAAARSRS